MPFFKKTEDQVSLQTEFHGKESAGRIAPQWGATTFVAFGFLVLSACGLSVFTGGVDAKSGASGPSASPTVVPPVPVLGSYLTTVLTDEHRAPLASIRVTTDSGLISTTTSDKGVFRIPLEALTDQGVDLNIFYADKSIPTRLVLPPDVGEQVRNVTENTREKVDRSLGAVLEKNLLDAATTGRLSILTRYLSSTTSLPLIAEGTGLNDNPLNNFKVSSHKNDDQVPERVTLSGICTAGYNVRVGGDVEEVKEGTCLGSGASGEFALEVNLSVGQGVRNVTLTHSDPNSGEYISTILVLRNMGCPEGFVRVPASRIERLGHITASNTNSNWWLNTSLDFCVMKHTARRSNTGTPVSTAASLPWTDVSQTDAANACSALGARFRIISNTQWQTIARNTENVALNWSGNAVRKGRMAKGHSDNLPAQKLEAGADFEP